MVELLQEYEMPVFMLEEADLNMRVLLDTGANLSVFNGTEDDLFSFFESASKTEYVTFINGFGGQTRDLTVYRIPSIRVDTTIIHNVLLVCHPFDMDIDFILAGTLLKLNRFSLGLLEKELEINSIGRDVYCVPQDVRGVDGRTVIASTTVFSQKEYTIS